MTDTFYNVPAAKQGRVAATHRRKPDGSTVADPNAPAAPVTRFAGGGGLFRPRLITSASSR